MADILKQILGSGETTSTETPEKLDKGSSVSDVIEGKNAGQGTLRGFLGRMMGSTPEQDVPGQMQGQGTVGGDPSRVPGTGVDPGLNPTPTAQQKVRSLAPTPIPLERPAAADYSMPSALDPNQIEELRRSLMTQSAQYDPANPNGLAGRMSSPNAEPDMGQQRNEAMGISDSIRGHDGVRAAKMKNRNEASAGGPQKFVDMGSAIHDESGAEPNFGPGDPRFRKSDNVEDRRGEPPMDIYDQTVAYMGKQPRLPLDKIPDDPQLNWDIGLKDLLRQMFGHKRDNEK